MASKYAIRTPRREKIPSVTSDDEKKDTVQVFCRLRPLKEDRESACIKLLSPTELVLTTPLESRLTRKEIHCQFRHIFTAYASQNEVFQHVAYPLLTDLLKGKNGLLFTYGVTGSGKTYTLTGDPQSPGIMPKCIYTIFNTINEYQTPKFLIKSDKMNGFEVQTKAEIMQDELKEVRAASKTPKRKLKDKIYENNGFKILDINENNLYSVFISYIEIYNNIVYDLLDDSSNKTLQSKILREDSKKNMYVNGVVEVEVKTAEEAFDLFNQGQKRKRMAYTILNSESSRSHSIFNIRIVQFQQIVRNEAGERMIPDTNQLQVAQLSLVDLAGSERTNRTQNTGKLLREASQINNSLMSLRTCLEILRENQQTGSNKLVPYRESRLTLLFKNYFEGDGKVEMIVCLNPSNEDFEENLQVVKFAEMTQDIKLLQKSESKYFTPCGKTPSKLIKKTPKVKAGPSFSLGPKLPLISVNFGDTKEFLSAIEGLVKISKIRIDRLQMFDTEFNKRERNYRKKLTDINQENVITTNELKSTKNLLKKEKQRNSNLESKISDIEGINSGLVGKTEELQNIIRQLRHTINEKDMKINKNVLEKEKTKQKLVLANEKMTQELDSKLRRQREHLQAAMKIKDTKLQQVRELLDKDISPCEIQEMKENVETQTPTVQYTPLRTRTRPIVPTSAARRRRSRSTGDVWLEHNAVKPVPLGTVLQPTMKKRKSVTKLSKASDVTHPKQSKYCLIAQEQDMDGETETKLYKADILPTCGGGAQVIFNDVECLKQESPTKSSD